MTAIAYLRRSRADPGGHGGAVSHAVQLAAVQDLAKRHGDADLEVLEEDWGRSGAESRTHLRGGYRELRRRVAAGEASAVYAYSLSRLARSTRQLLDLAELCAAARPPVPIRLAKEGEVDFSTSHGRLYLTVLGAVATFEAEVARERARDAAAARRARGDPMGRPNYGSVPGEDVAAVLDAFEQAGSFLGAARLLTARQVPARLGHGWHAQVVARIVRREAPEIVPSRVRAGAAARSTRALGGLLRCSCGQTLTSMGGPDATRWYCLRGHADDRHPRPYSVRESKLMPWIRAEAARLQVPAAIVREVRADEAAARELEARRERVVELWLDGVLRDRADRDRRLADIDAARASIRTRAEVLAVPAIDWQAEPAELSAVLSALWEAVELDESLLPVRAIWRVPEWRAE